MYKFNEIGFVCCFCNNINISAPLLLVVTSRRALPKGGDSWPPVGPNDSVASVSVLSAAASSLQLVKFPSRFPAVSKVLQLYHTTYAQTFSFIISLDYALQCFPKLSSGHPISPLFIVILGLTAQGGP